MNSAFMHPHFLWLLLVLPIAAFWQYIIANKQNPTLKKSPQEIFKEPVEDDQIKKEEMKIKKEK